MTELYIGLMSGTSCDGIDAALVDLSNIKPVIIATHYTSYPQALRKQILDLCEPGDNEIKRLGELDVLLGKEFAHAANCLLQDQALSPTAIKAIGSHGQTIRHQPHQPTRFTLQIGDPNTIAALTGITTVADFRRKDIAFGGQGAPLVAAFHQYALASNQINRAIVNIGGIANITLLSKNMATIIGFDTGPGNVLLDAWIHTHYQKTYDANGAWGASGRIHPPLLERLMADPYFHLSAPKSTGREYFNFPWLQNHLHALDATVAPVDVQATLVELTAQSILNSISHYFTTGEILICGGGVRNTFLIKRLKEIAGPSLMVASTNRFGIDPDWMEAVAFAWLACQTLKRQPGNVPSVTGAKQAVILGGIYFPY
jgi:anhydro-N-acetylmuramic acid kinase